MAGCNCDMGLGNTGRPNCVPIQSVTSKLILVPLYDVYGNKNRLNMDDVTLDMNVEFINAQDPSQRWFPLPEFENVEMPKADAQFEESNSGRMVFLRQGKRSFTGELWADDSSPQLLGKLQMNRCVDFGVFIVDVNGNLVGSQANADIPNYLYPIPVDNASWNPTLQFATDSTTQKIVVAFDFDRNFDESTLYMITSAEAGQDILALTGLVDVNFYNVNFDGTLDIEFSAWLSYGTALSKIKFTGANAGDFKLFWHEDGTYIDINSVNEDTAIKGNYYMNIDTALLNANKYTLSVSKNGFDGEFTFTFVD
jgi:hypothetical protein